MDTLASTKMASLVLPTHQAGSGTKTASSGGYGYGKWQKVLFYTTVNQDGSLSDPV